MALSILEKQTITKGCQAAKKVLEEVLPILNNLNVIYDSAGGVKTTITQQNMDLDPTLSGLTKQQLDDGMFALTSTLKNDMTTAFSQLAEIAARVTT